MKKDYLLGLFILVGLILSQFYGYSQIPATTKEQLFKDWNYSPTGVFGLVKMNDPKNQEYYKIFKPSNESVKIQEFNEAGIQLNTTLIRFINGKLSQITVTNQWGNTYEISKFTPSGLDEFLVTKKNTGENVYLPCKGAKFIYKNNLLTEVRYISYANKLAANSNGVSIIKYKRYTDKDRFSLTKEMAFYDASGKPVISTSNDCHKVTYEYDERGNQTSVAYFGINNEPLADRFGGFKNKYQYDENNKMILSETIGINDEITRNAYGVARVKYEYEDGFLSKSTRFDERDNITKASDAGDGVAIIHYEYDKNGNEILRSFFDENGKPMKNHSGYHKISYTYDSLNKHIATAYYDEYASPANDRKGIHEYKYVRDDKGRTTQESYYSNNNTPMQDDLHEVYMIKYKYDDQGRNISESYWENSATKMNRWSGSHESIKKYNDDGLLIENILLDQAGRQFVSKSGFSRVTTNYNAEAKVSGYKYFSGEKPANLENGFANGFHFIKFYYDLKGRLASLRYFDTSGQPVDAFIDMDNGFYCHQVEFIYKGNTIVEEKLYLKSATAPSRVIDCLKNNYIGTSGIRMGYKNR